MAYDQSGDKNPRWKGGRRKRRDGYVLVYQPGHPHAYRNFVLEHRLVVEKTLGRYLTPEEYVHHLNGRRDDNRPENLMLTSPRTHPSQHRGDPRQKRWKPRATREQILQLYWSRGLTKRQCAEELGLSYGAIHRHFEEFGIPARGVDPWWRRKQKHRNLSDFVIAIDSREKKPYVFNTTVRVSLAAGDYSVLGMEDAVAVERKRPGELYGCAGCGRERFTRELQRLAKLRYAAIVVEGTLADVLSGSRYSSVSPRAVVNSLVSWSVKYGVHVFFAGSRRLARGLTYRIIEKFCKHRAAGTFSAGNGP